MFTTLVILQKISQQNYFYQIIERVMTDLVNLHEKSSSTERKTELLKEFFAETINLSTFTAIDQK